MAISNLNPRLSDDWVLITSATPASGASSVSFTSIPARRKLLLTAQNATNSGGVQRRILLNGSTTDENYFSAFIYDNGTRSIVDNGDQADNNIPISFAATTTPYEYMIIDSANTSGPKEIFATGEKQLLWGLFIASAPITSIEYKLASSTFTSTLGSIKLYGCN